MAANLPQTELEGLYVNRRIVHIPESFQRIPLKALNERSKHEICLYLNPEDHVIGNYWASVAEQIGCRPVEIDNMRRKDNPMRAVIAEAIQRCMTLHEFLSIINELGRIDVLQECQQFINKDVEKYKDTVQDSEVTSSWKPLTVGDEHTGKPEYFDAFVSCDSEDSKFLMTLIEKLEGEHNFKLCVVERDLIPGIDQSEAMSELIEKRCRRVILVLSKSYSTSTRNMLNWQLSFSFSLAATAQINKLVPILIENEYTPPAILRPFHIPDYTNQAFRSWFWDRVVNTLRSELKPGSGYEGPPGPLGKSRESRPMPIPDRPSRSSTESSSFETDSYSGDSGVPPTSNYPSSSSSRNRSRSRSRSFEHDKQSSSSKSSGFRRFFGK